MRIGRLSGQNDLSEFLTSFDYAAFFVVLV